MPTKKKTATKKIGKKIGKKPSAKAAKSAKPKAKPAVKRSAKKSVDKDTTLKPVKVAGAAIVRPVDDPGTATEGNPVVVKPVFDKETGSIIMVPQE